MNISSVAARFGGGIGAVAYSSAKGALSVMTKGLAREFAPHGIRINAVSPGTIDTDYHRQFSTPQALESVAAATPMRPIGSFGRSGRCRGFPLLRRCSIHSRSGHRGERRVFDGVNPVLRGSLSTPRFLVLFFAFERNTLAIF